jgi:hypothetical protein
MYVEEFKSNEDVAEQYARYMDQEDKDHILKTLNESTVYIAWYGAGDYCGQSFVLFEHNGILYEVNASHCSCYGLEGQWAPEEADWRALAMRDHFHEEYDGSQTVNEYLRKLCEQQLGTSLQ